MESPTKNIKGLENITGCVVNYNTPDILEKAIKSVRMFYDFKIIVIDGSEVPCKVDYPNVEVIHVGYNIGHGLGLDMGIKMCETDYVLTFETDVEMRRPCIEQMLEKMKDDTYAIGKLYLKNNSDFYNKNRDLFPKHNIVRIVHPSFQIVNKNEYLKYAPYISDGAPTVLSYHDIERHGKSEEVLIDFPVLDYVYHRNAGTRDRIETPEYKNPDNPHWKEKWAKYIEEHPL